MRIYTLIIKLVGCSEFLAHSMWNIIRTEYVPLSTIFEGIYNPIHSKIIVKQHVNNLIT